MRLSFVKLLAFTILCFVPSVAWTQSVIAGDWQGSMKVNGSKLRLILHIREEASGMLTATIDSIDQDAVGLPVKTVTFADNILKLDVQQVNGTYEGVLSKDRNELKGTWSEGGNRDLKFKRVSDPAKLTVPAPIDGDWEGVLNRAGNDVDIYLHINTTSCTTIVGVLDAPGEAGEEILIRHIIFEKGHLKFSVDTIDLHYEGELNEKDGKFNGVWKHGEKLPLTLQRVSQPTRTFERPEGCRGEPSTPAPAQSPEPPPAPYSPTPQTPSPAPNPPQSPPPPESAPAPHSYKASESQYKNPDSR
jgi:hypothetical protein